MKLPYSSPYPLSWSRRNPHFIALIHALSILFLLGLMTGGIVRWCQGTLSSLVCDNHQVLSQSCSQTAFSPLQTPIYCIDTVNAGSCVNVTDTAHYNQLLGVILIILSISLLVPFIGVILFNTTHRKHQANFRK
jgi:hypothetical protein